MPVRSRWTTAVAALACVWSVLAASPATADTLGDVRYDADFLRSLQLRSGAIVSDVTRTQVEPYVGNHAAWALARATRYTGDPAYLNAALRWLYWYQKKMDAAGLVYDQTVVRGVAVPTADTDSVDATNAVFLLAFREAYWATPLANRSFVLGMFSDGIRRSFAAIEALRDTDGLTWAKPTWHVKYLMDNAEAYGGMLAAKDLGVALGDRALVAAATDGAARSRLGLSGLWNPATQAYDWAKHANGYRQPTDWAVLYPDAVEQAWAVAFGLADARLAGALMERFGQSQPNWDRPTATATYWDGAKYPHAVDFWPVAGWAFAALGDTARAAAGAAHIREGAWALNRQPPYTAAAQAQLILLMTGGLAGGGQAPLR